jgi:hypothetical protein
MSDPDRSRGTDLHANEAAQTQIGQPARIAAVLPSGVPIECVSTGRDCFPDWFGGHREAGRQSARPCLQELGGLNVVLREVLTDC